MSKYLRDTPKKFLFLQSHPSLFGRQVIKYLRESDVDCSIINLSLSDWGYRIGLRADNYWGTLANWPDYLRTYLKKKQITDLVYYADQRPYHRIAYKISRELKINTFSYEFGYLRPDWITLERGAMGPFSHFPNKPALIRKLASDLDQNLPGEHYPYTFFSEAFNEVAYNFVPALFPVFFPFYQRDRYYHPFRDYPSYIPRLLTTRFRETNARLTIQDLKRRKASYFVVPMQMQNDYQVRNHAGYLHLSEMVEEIISSFVRSSPTDQHLVFKVHPLDNSIEQWPKVIRQTAERYQCQSRVIVIDGGNLVELFRHSKGVVLLNSTSGLQALQQGIPVKVLGISVYDVDGMTCQNPLDQFWKKPTPPDRPLVNDFVRLLAASIQVKGNFFSARGRRVAVPEFARRLVEGDVNSHGAFVEMPPRLEKARQLGVRIPADSYWRTEESEAYRGGRIVKTNTT
ncbi:capsule biosynthesis protein [Roseibium sp. MMSF_3544]|uniref:capsule biosynthesis protein n=1 Tax=unclassified Roseibium TaxID=2629323 RepID=UPI00273FE84F|nr:capsular biosynthesis protein [Roseibium sp. MMSF_3544]